MLIRFGMSIVFAIFAKDFLTRKLFWICVGMLSTPGGRGGQGGGWGEPAAASRKFLQASSAPQGAIETGKAGLPCGRECRLPWEQAAGLSIRASRLGCSGGEPLT